ncbi:ATP-dependent DNA helicase Q1 [Megalops cyprinoides]|uniref:ATP-dependent DNA helicase Q1 n=1 Tax=Megalops cyprinoides TaxID=118141 RepID=UPI001864815A|nr:ATP-dependent DNA helicase Q1 [Megalops cyprinoides]
MERDSVNEVQAELEGVEAELEVVELQISELLERQAHLNSRKKQLLKKLEQACDSAQPSGSAQPSAPVSTKQDLKRYEGADFPWSQEVQKQLSAVFQLHKFRPLQLLAINLTMSGKDIFLVMPTGRGKSLCYQLPAVCSEGFTLVIAPLVSLMEDQLMYLKSVSVSAVTLNASSTKEHAKWVMGAMTEKKTPFKLLYVTPEKISKSKLLMSRLEKAYNAGTLERIAVDEVHCCSQWGHDFRPDYKLLGILKRQFPKVPMIGLTATATSSVLKDCQKILCVPEPITLTASFNRPNLYYEVRMKETNSEDSTDDIVALIQEKYKDQSGIIYVFSQKDAEVVSANLQKKGILAQPYHANMEAADKSRVHRHWTTNKIQVVVATVAFGMGIDKPDVRFVIHHSLSKSMENYYQESGRAGRDDKPADCILYFGFADIFRISTMVVMENVGQQKLMQMVAYCQTLDRCRRTVMASHFDEVWDDEDCNQMCDICRHGNDYATVDITQHAREAVQVVEVADSMNEKMTPLKVVEAWMGKGPAKRRKMIQVTTLSRVEVEAILIHLLLQGYFSEDFSFTPYTTYFYLKLGRKAGLLKNDKHTVTMKMKRNVPAGDSVKVSRHGNSAQTKGGKRSGDKAGLTPPVTKKSKEVVL